MEVTLNSMETEMLGKSISFPYDTQHRTHHFAGSYFSIDVKVPELITSKLISISNQSDVRLHIILVAGIIAILQRYSGEKYLTIGSPLYSEETSEDANSNFIPISCTFDETLKFRELVQRVSQSIRETYNDEGGILENFNCDPSSFGVAVMLDGLYTQKLSLMSRPSIMFVFSKTADSIKLRVEFDDSLYETMTVQAIFNNLIQLWNTALFHVDLPLIEIDVVTEEERMEILNDYNNTNQDWPSSCTLHGLFTQQVKRTPEHIALVYGEERLTYRELDKRSDYVAQLLLQKGVSAENIIGIMVERSIAMVVGIIGILKSGAAYLPIAPNCPQARALSMLEECSVPLILTNSTTFTESEFLNNIKSSNVTEIINLDCLVSYSIDEQLLPIVDSAQLAYIMFTSGSTGKPKGVMLEHRNAVNTVDWFKKITNLNEDSRSMLTYNFTSDPSVEDIFAPLSTGAILFITDEYLTSDRERFRAFVNEHNIHILNFVPRIIRELLSGASKLESLDIVLSGGEELDDSLKNELIQLGYVVYNNYGPTEAAIDCLSERCGPLKVTLGQPIQNMKCYILNAAKQLVPIGGVGELCISGVGVARGYITQEELTNKRFINCPFGTGERMYLTGDLAKYSRGSTIEFLGRRDSQVKINGYRVELGEIEAILTHNPQVTDAVVIARSDMKKDSLVICAYVVFKEGDQVQELKKSLTEWLPSYMMPSYIISMKRIPLNMVGKVDKLQLPKPVIHSTLPESVSVISNKNEDGSYGDLLVSMWCEVLQVDDVSRSSNFFELGGTSMDMIKIGRMIQDKAGLNVSLVNLFKYPTINSLEQFLEKENLNK